MVAAFAVVGAAVAVLAVADEAEAVHFWSGTLTSKQIVGVDGATVQGITGYLSYDTKAIPGGTVTINASPLQCNTDIRGLRIPYNPVGWGFLTANGVELPYDLIVVEYDPAHCRFIGEIVAPGTILPIPVPAASGTVNVAFDLCCRENAVDGHINNPEVHTHMVMTIDALDGAPSVVFDIFAPPNANMSEKGYGNIHCPINVICNIQVPARDPERGTLTYRLSTSMEASGGWGFQHPGPSCGGCATGPYSIGKFSGLISWDTTGASVGTVYSSQVMISDGINTVPLDFMVELGDEPEPCWDSSKPEVDPFTGEIICPEVPPPDCPPGTYRKDPGNPYSECIFPPEEEYQPVYGEPKPKSPFWLPEPTYKQVKDPARSDVQHAHAHAHDRINEEIARLDQDGDGARDRDDLCLDDVLTQEQDLDGDGIGDACDPDMDGDGVENALDPCSFDPGDLCVKPSAPPEAETLGKTTLGDVLAGAAAPQDRGGAEKVPVASVAPSKSPTGSIMLAVLGGALLLLLMAIAMRRRDE